MNPISEHLSSKRVLLRDAAQSFFSALRESIRANTFFLAEHDGRTNLVLSAWNHEETLVTEGMELPVEVTYSHAVCRAKRPVIIEDTTRNSMTMDLPITRQLGACSFLGVPVVLRNGRLFGTVCVLDRQRVFTQDDVKQVERLSDFLSRLIDLEETIVYDELTGLYRRGYLEMLFYNLPADSPKAVAYLDLDDFTTINETFGREIGDQVLQRAGAALEKICASHQAHACRYAGDEFVLLFAAESDDKVLSALDHFMEELSQPIAVSGYPLPVTASIGICLQASSYQQYIQRADTAMNEIKRGTKVGIQVFSMTRWDKTLEFTLNRALEDKRFQLVYQPIVDAKTGSMAAIEALIRWDTEEHGLLAPPMFLPFAERIGLIQKIDLWVIREACSQFTTMPNWEQAAIALHVNISGKSLRNAEFAVSVTDILEEYGLPSQRLVIELNEKTCVYEASLIGPQVKRLADRGVCFALDDFGQGYASLGMLTRFPVTAVKMDKSFVHNIMTDPVCESIAGGLASIADKLRLRLIAEGVETCEQREKLMLLKCQQMQGHYFFEPLTFTELCEAAVSRFVSGQKGAS